MNHHLDLAILVVERASRHRNALRSLAVNAVGESGMIESDLTLPIADASAEALCQP